MRDVNIKAENFVVLLGWDPYNAADLVPKMEGDQLVRAREILKQKTDDEFVEKVSEAALKWIDEEERARREAGVL